MKSVSANNMIFIAIIMHICELGLTPYFSRVSYNIPYIAGFIACFFARIRSCMHGLSSERIDKTVLQQKVSR